MVCGVDVFLLLLKPPQFIRDHLCNSKRFGKKTKRYIHSVQGVPHLHAISV